MNKKIDNKIAQLANQLREKIDKCRNGISCFYIGLTTDLEERLKDHKQEGWDRMIRLYTTKSRKIAIYLEKDLIKYSKKHYSGINCNKGQGGEGVREDEPLYTIYMLIAYDYEDDFS